jgi:hypothetical protein
MHAATAIAQRRQFGFGHSGFRFRSAAATGTALDPALSDVCPAATSTSVRELRLAAIRRAIPSLI